MGSIWQRYDALATDSDAGSASGARVFTPFVATLRHLLTSRPLLPGVSTQIPGVGVPASDSMAYSHSHSLDSVAGMVTTAASAAVSKVIGMTRTEAGLSVQNAAMKVQWYVLLPSPHLTPRHPFLLTAPTSSTRQTRRPSLKRTYTSSAYNASSRSATASRGKQFPSTTAPQSRQASRRIAGARASARPARLLTLPESEPARVGLQTGHAMVTAVWPALLAALSFLFTTNLSDSLFGDVLGTLQALASIAGYRSAHAARRVPHHARKSRAPTMHRRCAQLTTRVVGAALPCLAGRDHAREARPETEPVEFGMLARTRHCCDVSSWRAGPQLVRGA